MAIKITDDCINFIEIKEFPFYFVGSDGNVYSKRATGNAKNCYSNPLKKMQGTIGKQGYLTVNLKNHGKNRRVVRVSTLVAEHFLRLPNIGEVIQHIDGNIHNNQVSNLKYISSDELVDPVKDTDIEYWKCIPDYEGYYKASNLGNIRSLDRIINRTLVYGKLMRQHTYDNGYRYIGLAKGRKSRTYSVHRLILKIFRPNKDCDNLQCNHIDSNPSNNNIDNLEWCTASENIYHAYKHGKMTRKGDKHNNRKLSQKMAHEIIDLYKNTSMTQKEIGERYEVCGTTISNVINKKTWNYGY